MAEVPDQIWASLDKGMLSTGRWVTQGTENPFGRVEYLRATPERRAATDLLAAASEALDFIESIESRSGVQTSAGNILRAAISKARGQV